MRYARFVLRSLWFAAALVGMGIDFLLLAIRHRGSPPMSARTTWLRRSSRRTLRIFNVQFKADGPLPKAGLLVSNHLSYIDILVYSSLTGASFVSKSEVRYWPVFGWYARAGGTVFVRRARRMEAGSAGEEIRRIMQHGQLVVLFPEGTSSNGKEVLPFKSSLLEPATNPECPLQVAAITYTLPDGRAEEEVCYWGDATFFPHFIRLMTKEHVKARVRFATIQRPTTDRKQLAQYLHSEVVQLKNAIGAE